MFNFKKLLFLGVIAPVINLFISGVAIASPSAVVNKYDFNGSYKLINTSIDTHILPNLDAGFKKPESNFFNSFIRVYDTTPAMEYHFEIPVNATHATATLYFSGILDVENSHKPIRAGVSCTANVSISNNMLTLSNPVCHAYKYHFTMTFNGKPTAVFSLKANSFPQLDISYISS